MNLKRLIQLTLGTTVLTMVGCSIANDYKEDRDQKNTSTDHVHDETCQWENLEHNSGFNFATSQYKWDNPNVSVSFMPDGTKNAQGGTSALYATLGKHLSEAVWKKEVLRGLQRWSQVSNLNFRLVSDNGGDAGSGANQNNPNFGDIRVGTYDMGSGLVGSTYSPWPYGSTGGDLYFNPLRDYYTEDHIKLSKAAVHEFGHSIGMMHSDRGTVMYSVIQFAAESPIQDDIDGIQSLYGARTQDSFDQAGSNDQLGNASSVSMSGLTASVNADITSIGDVDYYQFTAPGSAGSNLTVSLAAGKSLLTPALEILDASGASLASGAAGSYGEGVSLAFDGAAAGETYYIKVSSNETDEFGFGLYQASIAFDAGDTSPPPPPGLDPDAYEANDSIGAAKYLGRTRLKVVSGLTIHDDSDVDFFSFRTDKRRANTYRVQISGDSDVTVTVYKNGSQIATGQNSVSFSVSRNTLYVFEVRAADGSTVSYSAEVRRLN